MPSSGNSISVATKELSNVSFVIYFPSGSNRTAKVTGNNLLIEGICGTMSALDNENYSITIDSTFVTVTIKNGDAGTYTVESTGSSQIQIKEIKVTSLVFVPSTSTEPVYTILNN